MPASGRRGPRAPGLPGRAAAGRRPTASGRGRGPAGSDRRQPGQHVRAETAGSARSGPVGGVAGPVDLLPPGIGGHQEVPVRARRWRAGRRSRRGCRCRAVGRPAIAASTWAVTTPTRRPVNGPGPSPTTISVEVAGVTPARPTTRRIGGVSCSTWAIRSSTTWPPPYRPPAKPTVTMVEVSSPRTSRTAVDQPSATPGLQAGRSTSRQALPTGRGSPAGCRAARRPRSGGRGAAGSRSPAGGRPGPRRSRCPTRRRSRVPAVASRSRSSSSAALLSR